MFLSLVGLVRRGVTKRLDGMDEDHAESRALALEAIRQVHDHDTRIGVIEAHIENGSKERGEIKSSIDALSGRIDTLISHALRRAQEK